MVVVSPENTTLLELSAQAYCSYTFGFLEDDLEQIPEGDAKWEPLRKRATDLYKRCEGYGLRLLHLADDHFPEARSHDFSPLSASVAKIDDMDAVPGMFWTGLALASQINLNRDDLS